MERSHRLVRLTGIGLVVFLTVGITLANETLSRLGVDADRLVVISVAMVITVFLASRNIVVIVAVVAGVVAVNLPDSLLTHYNLDRDLLLASIGALILLPSIYSLVFR
ncbi:MAG: hypothetical protein WDZ76_04280 [Pseudohongiellaceae bacterium]